MNIEDISSDEIPTDFSRADRLDMIFDRQHSLVEKYLLIEEKNGLLHTKDCPVQIDDRFGQARLKDFFWRVTEELTEAVDAARVHGHIPNHTYEEVADALHFLVEACILAGLSSEDFRSNGADKLEELVSTARMHAKAVAHTSMERPVYEVIHEIGCASNCLKQRPWKNTHQLTDKSKFYPHLKSALFALIEVFVYFDFTADEIFRMYWKKSEVNNFRIRSNY